MVPTTDVSSSPVGMLSNSISAMDAEELREPWARTLVGDLVFKAPR
jgi:hypothetical protein